MSKPITIVQWWTNYPKSPTSAWQRMLNTVQRCHKEGWRNYIVWTKLPDDKELIEPFKKAGCDIILQPQPKREFDFSCIWRTFKLLRYLKCDILHCYNDQTSPLIGGWMAGVPFRVWSKLSMSPYYEKKVIPKGLHRLMLSNRVSGYLSHRILALSNEVRNELKNQGVLKTIDIVPVPVDYKRFAEAKVCNIRNEIGLDSSSVLITAVGHAFTVKGWDIALRAFAKVHQEAENARLLLIGGIDTCERERQFYKELKKLNDELSISDYVHFLGKRHDIPELLKSSDVFIFPSRSEGMGSALVEAITSGLPCVASKVGGIPEVITEGENGLLFERENSEQLAQCVLKLINNKTLRTKLALHASIRAKEFSMEKYINKIFECYEKLLNNKLNKN